MVLRGSEMVRPVTYMDMYSLELDSKKFMPMLPLGVMSMEGK
jgi:hypothetical protein